MERPRHFEVVKNPWFMYCETCRKVLYMPTEDNIVTRTEAMMSGWSHKNAFSEEHSVYIVDCKNGRFIGRQD